MVLFKFCWLVEAQILFLKGQKTHPNLFLDVFLQIKLFQTTINCFFRVFFANLFQVSLDLVVLFSFQYLLFFHAETEILNFYPKLVLRSELIISDL